MSLSNKKYIKIKTTQNRSRYFNKINKNKYLMTLPCFHQFPRCWTGLNCKSLCAVGWSPLASFCLSWHPPHSVGHTESKTLQLPQPEARPHTTTSSHFFFVFFTVQNKENLERLELRLRMLTQKLKSQQGRRQPEECSFQ